MSVYKTILVPVDQRERSERSLAVATDLARRFDSHLVGLYVRPYATVPSAVRIEPGADLLLESQRKAIDQFAAEARGRFDAAVKRAGVGRAEWRDQEGDAAEVCALHARYADLLVLNQTDSGDSSGPGPTNFAEAIVLSVGRPVLLVPYIGPVPEIGRNVLVCWNGSREAARALTDSLPFLSTAQSVRVLAIDPRTSGSHGEQPSADISLYLARHGVNAIAARTPSAGIDAGSVILSQAADYGIDLIVMGAYGHSRLRELVMGGATRTILRQMTAPVLMSH